MRKVLFLILFILIFGKSVLADQQKEYSPYPIIFVHGYNASEPPRWDTAKINLDKYFVDLAGFEKYPALDIDLEYFPLVNYGYQKTGLISRNGDIPTIASQVLLPDVKWALDKCFPVHYSESERKVIIVAHSMGGLVVRSFLTQFPEYQKKIDKVIFVDVPNLGSPYASAVWMIDKEAKEKLPPLIKKYSTFFSKSVGILKFLAPPLGVGAENIFNHISWNLQDRLRRDNDFLWSIENIAGTDPDGYAIDKMRLPFQSEYHDKVEGWHGFKYISEPIDIVYGPSETFLGAANLAVPSNFKIISGEVPEDPDWLSIAFETVKDILFWYREGSPLGFSFERGYTLEDTKTTGDGVVPKLSQEKLTKEMKAKSDYTIVATHGQAPDAWRTILKAIEGKPEIESAYAIPVDWNKTYPYEVGNLSNSYYLIIKVKDYLLADIGVEKLDLITDNKTIDLLASIPPQYKENDVYKPYLQFNKYFLQERDCDGGKKGLAKYTDISGVNKKYLHLKPGEFFIETKIPYNAQSIYIKIKNPADQFDPTHTNFTAKKTFYLFRPKVNAFWTFYGIDVPPYMPPDPTPGAEPWPHSSDFYFDIKDSPASNITTNIWLYDKSYYYDSTPNIIKKFKTNYMNIPLTPSGTITLPDGVTQIALYSGGYDKNNPFATWSGEKDSGGTVTPYETYYLKVTVEPSDVTHNDNLIFILGSGMASIAADPTFIQPSRREGITW